MEPRRRDKRSKGATQLHNTVQLYSAACCNKLPRVRTTVLNFITHTGQINYFALHCDPVMTYATLTLFRGASGYEPELSCVADRGPVQHYWQRGALV